MRGLWLSGAELPQATAAGAEEGDGVPPPAVWGLGDILCCFRPEKEKRLALGHKRQVFSRPALPDTDRHKPGKQILKVT